MSAYGTGRELHIDQHLSQIAINYRPMGFIADRVFPLVTVPKQTDKYVIFEQADLFRQENTRRSRGGEANKIHSRVSSDGFHCDNYALKADVTIEDRANMDPIFIQQFEEGRVNRVMDGLALDEEIRVAALMLTLANVGTYAAVGSAWSDFSNSDPINDLLTKIDQVEDATGYRPNKAVFSGLAWRNFRRNASVIDKSTNPNVTGGGIYPSVQQAEAVLEMEIIVGGAYKNTAEEAIAMSLDRIWADHVALYYAPDAPSTQTPSAGYRFRWAAPGLPNRQVERHPYDTRRHCDEVEVGYYQDEKIVSQPLIALVTNTTSSS